MTARPTEPATPDTARTVAFLDLGTNSMRLLVVRIEPNGSYAILTQQKETVRLGEGEFATDEMQPEAIDRAVLVGSRFAAMARSFGAEQIVAVATSATREAVNRQDLLDRLRDGGGLDVRVISGREEARLVYLGVSSDIPLDGDTALFVDVGGGSTELVVGDRDSHHYLDTLRLGAIRIANLFFLPGDTNPIDDERYRLVQRFVRAQLVRSVQRLGEYTIDRVVGSSGTIVTLGEIASRRFLGRPLEKLDTFPVKQLEDVVRTLCELPLAERLRVPGMSSSRGDIIVPGALIFLTLMEDLGLDRITVSDRSLRDGLLIDHLARHDPSTEHRDLSFRAQSVLRLAKKCRTDLPHVRHVTALALELFDTARVAGLHDLGDDARELLEYAGILHDVGVFLTYTNHRQHSYYFIKNAELLGFDETEVAIIALTAMFHKKTYPRKRNHPEFAAIDKRSQGVVRVLCTLLRIAESLDRSHAKVARHARLDVDGGEAVLTIDAVGDCELEIWSVGAHAKAFRRTFDVGLRIEPRVADRTARAASYDASVD